MTEDLQELFEEHGYYHFEPTTRDEYLRYRLRPIAEGDQISKSKVGYGYSPDLYTLLTWQTACFSPEEHGTCRGGHRFLYTHLCMADMQQLRIGFPEYQPFAPSEYGGQIWIGLCPYGGTAIRICVGDRIWMYETKILANHYEVITTNDADSFNVGILVHNSASTDTIVAKFWAQDGEVGGGFRHFMDPTNFPKLNKLRVIEGSASDCTVHIDGRTEFTHILRSFNTLPDFAPISRLNDIINQWDDATDDFRL